MRIDETFSTRDLVRRSRNRAVQKNKKTHFTMDEVRLQPRGPSPYGHHTPHPNLKRY